MTTAATRVGRELFVHADSPVRPEDLTDAERERLPLASPNSVVMLEQLGDGRFNIRGNAVVMCTECDAVLIGHSGTIGTLKQRHLSVVHGTSAPLLPPSRTTI